MKRHHHYRIPHHQRGAALFVVMMFLIVMSIVGIMAARISGNQERMARGYLSDNQAFQQAEARLRLTEEKLRDGSLVDPCSVSGVDPSGSWSETPPPAGESATPADHIENLNSAKSAQARSGGTSGTMDFGTASQAGDVTCLFFKVSSMDYDNEDQVGSRSIVQSVFVP